ncbi:hypothetical protein NIES3585_12650 [Nodularia sp. NIES-3585]|nr:hypothetical protein NIES3585_12650 [Nodularia sp. NIES-3585]
MERLYRGFDMITNRVHISTQQRPFLNVLTAEIVPIAT